MSSSTSLSSSFSSSASSSMLQHAASSQSDIVMSDHSAPSTPPKKQQISTSVSPAPRSSSLGVMGQSHGHPQPPAQAPSLVTSALSLPTSASKGFKLKRAFGGRRKQSEDPYSATSSPIDTGSNKGRDGENTDGIVALSAQNQGSANRRGMGARQLTLQLASAFTGKQAPASPTTRSPLSAGSPPPPLPPKPVGMTAGKKYVPPAETSVDRRGSVMPSSPSIAAALHYMQDGESSATSGAPSAQSREKAASHDTKPEMKETWRKSDSDMSFNTIRPGAGTVGNRNSRPVSMAESVQSTHTIVPTNKRLSALLTDADFAMAEEDDGENRQNLPPTSFSSVSLSRKSSPSGSVKTKNRRSASLHLPSSFALNKTPSPTIGGFAQEDGKNLSRSSADSPRLSPSQVARETPTLTRAAANGYIAPTYNSAAIQSTGNNIKGRLTAWTATNSNSSPLKQDRSLPSEQTRQQARQPAVSITSGFGPAAGLAKRAVEKMGRAWGGMSSSAISIHSTSTSTSSSSLGNQSVEELGGRPSFSRSSPAHSTTGSLQIGKGKKQRRTPNGPSGNWSLSSSSSVSDCDVPDGPTLGHCLRGPTRLSNAGTPIGGAVFGRDLRSCVAETAIIREPADPSGRPQHLQMASASMNQLSAAQLELENRRVPALIVRSAQHILSWGVQEEGLFRLTGRPSHMSKIRAEFDTGADYNLLECTLGDLDPHAVSSVFKAYLRELPEPILTHSLTPYFEAALSAEAQSRKSEEKPHAARGMQGPTLPSSPKSGGPAALRKPPSLSTLAMPSFTGMRPPSESLTNALKGLVAALPQENRDLLHTVVDLIKATAKQSKETKMPLSNLLLVFCPSLNMNPPMLRALCEVETIWDVPANHSDDQDILDIKRDSFVMDIGPVTPRASQNPADDGASTLESSDDEEEHSDNDPEYLDAETKPNRPAVSLNTPERSGSPAYSGRPLPRVPPPMNRAPVSTLYFDSESTPASPESSQHREALTDFADSGSLASRSNPGSPALPNPHSPPSLSSSTDSLATPSEGFSSAAPSSSNLPLSNDQYSKDKGSDPSYSPVIVEPGSLPLPSTPRRNASGGDVQFPTSGSAPTTPVTRRPSVPFLSLTGDTAPSDGPPSASSLKFRRIKKPSLHLLFSRRSSASLHSASLSTASISAPTPYLQPSHSPNTSNSTPLSSQSMFTAHSSTPNFPPVLDLPIETAPLRLGMGLDEEKRRTLAAKPSSSHSNRTVTEEPKALSTDSSSPAAVTPGPKETPIADFYSTPSTSTLSFDLNQNTQPLRLRPRPGRPSGNSNASSSASFNHLSMALPDEATADDDWAQSVFAAADSEGNWSAKKLFGSNT